MIRGDVSVKQFASELGVSAAYIYALESGEKTAISDTLAALISTKYNLERHWLLTGEGEMRRAGMMVCEDSAQYNDFVYVPQVSGEISAGGGLVPDNTVEMRIAFRKEWIERRGDPRNMSLIRVSGDSMEPTLQSGDLVLIDHGRNFIDPQGGIYAISMDDTIMIKRLQLIYPTKTLKIISDNSRYAPLETVSDQVKVNGKVIWFGRELER